jgi:RNA polymerase sigma-70 factor (ECF subfamily)
MQAPVQNETAQLASARTGDHAAFDALLEPHRKPLLVHCYRISGSLDDAEDLVQETILRAWNKLTAFEGQGSFRNWLYVIASRLWLDEVRRRKKRVLLPLDGDPADPESRPPAPVSPASWLDPLPESWLSGAGPSPEHFHERRETISLAFTAALQRLNASQRVVLILREVFNWSAQETAEALELTVDAVNNLLYRARKNLENPRYEESPAQKPHLDAFVRAWEAGDVHTLIQLLHQKATFAMPPMNAWYAGRAAIQRALRSLVFTPGAKWKLVPISANGRPAFGIYRGQAGSWQAFGLLLPVYSEGMIAEVTAFLSPQLVLRFGLPQTL